MANMNDDFFNGLGVATEAALDTESSRGLAPVTPASAPPAKKMFLIVIEEEENALNYVPVGVGGVVWQIMRGVEVEIPDYVLEVLKNAKATRIVQTRQPDGTMLSTPRAFNRYPYRVLGEVPQRA